MDTTITCSTCYAEVLYENREIHLMWHAHITRSLDIAVASGRYLRKLRKANRAEVRRR